MFDPLFSIFAIEEDRYKIFTENFDLDIIIGNQKFEAATKHLGLDAGKLLQAISK